jgi:hypothetical protein
LNYYKIQGKWMLVNTPSILDMDDTQLRRLSTRVLTRMSKNDIIRRGMTVPASYHGFHEQFTIGGEEFIRRIPRKAMANALTQCIKSRLEYRKQCVTDCSTNIPTGRHDEFIIKLAILRARLLRDLAN